VQRYWLRWTHPVSTIVCEYFAIQGRDLPWATQAEFFARVKTSLDGAQAPGAFEIMRCTDTQGYSNAIIVAYWLDAVAHARWTRDAAILTWLHADERLAEPYGYWRETFSTPFDRHETNYSYNDYKIGLARCEPAHLISHDINAYFGAMRDRIPLSAVDPLDSPFGATMPNAGGPETFRRRVRIMTPLNLTVIRSGQFWANARKEQWDDYLDNLQPKLLRGMDYIETHKETSGCCVMRMMYNLDENGREKPESSVLSYFLSLQMLEDWAKSHETHLDIYRHAIAMMRKYGEEREVRTWHEVFVLPTGGGLFEYVNCHPKTGLIPFFRAL